MRKKSLEKSPHIIYREKEKKDSCKKKKGKRNSWITVDSFFFKKSFYFWTVRFALRFMPVSMRKKKLASATAEIRLHALEFTICFFISFIFYYIRLTI